MFLHCIYLRLSCEMCVCLVPPSWAIHLMCLLLFHWENRSCSRCRRHLLAACSGTRMPSAPASPPPFTVHKFVSVAPQLECLSSEILPFLHQWVSSRSFQQLCNCSHLKKPVWRVCFSSPLCAALHYKTPGENYFHLVPVFLPSCSISLQSGFCLHPSRKAALVKVVHDLHVAKSSCQFSVLILLDLLAAFDTVDNSVFLDKLSTWLLVHRSRLHRCFSISFCCFLLLSWLLNTGEPGLCSQTSLLSCTPHYSGKLTQSHGFKYCLLLLSLFFLRAWTLPLDCTDFYIQLPIPPLLSWVNDTCFKLDSVNSTSYFYPQTAPPVIFPDSGNGNSVFPVSQAKNPVFSPASPVKSAFKASLLVTCTAESAWPLLWITECLLTVLPALLLPFWLSLHAVTRLSPLQCVGSCHCPAPWLCTVQSKVVLRLMASSPSSETHVQGTSLSFIIPWNGFIWESSKHFWCGPQFR